MFKMKCKLNGIVNLLVGIFCVILVLAEVPIYVLATEVNVKSDRIIVSLGDSYSSGEGIEPFYGQNDDISKKIENKDWLAHRSEKSWPGMLKLNGVDGTMAENRGTHWYFSAVSGATTADIITSEYYGSLTKEEKENWKVMVKEYYKITPISAFIPKIWSGEERVSFQLDIFDELEEKNQKADYVTVTLGGNDADFVGIIKEVAMGSTYLSTSVLSDKLNETWKNFYKEGGIEDNLLRSYKDISKNAGSQAQIIIAGYPKLLDSEGEGFLISKEEAQLVNIAVSNFNNAIEHIVNECSDSEMKISFVSVEEAFEGHGAYSNEPYINEIIFGVKSQDLKDIDINSAYSIHPNENGARAYAKCVQEQIDMLEGISPITYSTNFSISTFGYNGKLCTDYTIIVKGRKDVALWGLINKEYYDEILINEYMIVPMNLPKGKYTITVTDGESSYFKNIEIRKNSKNKELIFNTNFGDINQNNDMEEEKKETNIPKDVVVFNNHWYKVIQDNSIYTWQNAKQYCESQNGYLATITSQEENDFLYSYIMQQGYSSAYFGFSDAEEENTWKWSNAEEVVYTNWHSGEPNSENSNEDYAMFYYKFKDGTWNDGNFGNESAFICEWEDNENISEMEKEDSTQVISKERDIVLVLDTSGSMSGTPITETKSASIKFVDRILDEEASIGIVAYNDNAQRKSDFSINKSELKNMVLSLYDNGGTNIEAGLEEAEILLDKSNAKKKIIVLMSDGQPNSGKEGDELIAYANKLKDDGILIYTIGFFESLDNDKSSAQRLMEKVASDGCHYEVATADELVFFFEDMADQINGQKYIYVRIACPVDVSITYNGQMLNSSEDKLSVRTDFGTLTFEENEEGLFNGRIKVLRLKEGVDYDLELVGTGRGIMNYTIGFMNEDGEYNDFRKFENIKITKKTQIDTVAGISSESILKIDEDGDGKYDLKLRAEENGYGEEIKINDWIYYATISVSILTFIYILIVVIFKIRKEKGDL